MFFSFKNNLLSLQKLTTKNIITLNIQSAYVKD